MGGQAIVNLKLLPLPSLPSMDFASISLQAENAMSLTVSGNFKIDCRTVRPWKFTFSIAVF
jgi:hypothetical protein